MKPHYEQATKVEFILAHMFQKMENQGWPVDLNQMDRVETELDDNLAALHDHIVPQIPMTPNDGKWKVVEKPFTKSGKLAAACKYVTEGMSVFNTATKKMEEFIVEKSQGDLEIVGPFCKVRWDIINIRSDKQVKKYLLSIGWKPTEWNINKKTREVTGPKMTEDSYDSLKTDVGQQLALFLKLSHRKSMIQGFRKIVWTDDKGQPRISQIVSGMTPTFRCTHKGIVNVPGADAVFGLAIRSIFIAEEGYVQLGVDAKSCQLRNLCNYMKDPIYTEAVLNGNSKDGTDIHSVNMRLTDGLVTKRSQAKRFIYGLLFGAANPKLGAIVGGGTEDGKRLRETFMSQLPTLAALLDGLERGWKNRGYLVGLDGRKVFPRAKHQLLVYLVQSAEAIIMRWTLALLYKWNFFTLFDVKLVGFIHDEVQFNVRPHQAELAAQWVCAAMEAASKYLKHDPLIEGDPAIGKNWKATH